MACEVVWSLSAEADRDRIVEYLLIELNNRQAAARFMDELDCVIDTIEKAPASFPASAEPRLERMGYHKASFMSYVAIYRTDGNRALMARIFHQRQDYARLV